MSVQSLIPKLYIPKLLVELKGYFDGRKLLNPLVTLYVQEYKKLEGSPEEWKTILLDEAMDNCLSPPKYQRLFDEMITEQFKRGIK